MTLTEKQAPADADAPPLGPDDDAGGGDGARSPATPDGGSPARVVQLIVAVAALTAIFVLLGLGDLLLFIAILVVIVMLHELGHFVTAKRAGMKVTEYFVGFGPRLWSVRRGETEYGVKAIPAGGYVRIIGFTSTEEVAEEDEARAYRQQPFHQRIIVASAGSAMHLLIAFVLALIVVLGYGQATNNYKVSALEHWPGKTTPAAIAGLRAGDTIVSINGKAFATPTAMTDIVKRSTGKPLNLGVERGGRLIHLEATPASGTGITTGGQKLSNRGYIGVTIGAASAPVSLLGAPGAAVSNIWSITSQTASGVGQLFSPHGLSSIYHQVTNSKAATSAADNPGSAPRPVSIVGIASIGSQTEEAGILAVLSFLIAINIAFAIFNMLPMIPLDGGHVAIAAYEWIRTRKGEPYYRADITKLMPVAVAFIAFLLLFVFASLYLDITHPLQLP
jgi:membrane-associated protease RseP (regulator of RpoE activity)